MRDYDVFVLRCRRDPASDAPSLSLVEVKLNLAQPNQSIVIPLSLAMARALPQCGVLTTAGYLSLRSRDNVPNDGFLWDPEAQQAVTVAKLARAVGRARFNDVPQFPPPDRNLPMLVRATRGTLTRPTTRAVATVSPTTLCMRVSRLNESPRLATGRTHRVAIGTHAVATNGSATMAMRWCSTRLKSQNLPRLRKCEESLKSNFGLPSLTMGRYRRSRSSTI